MSVGNRSKELHHTQHRSMPTWGPWQCLEECERRQEPLRTKCAEPNGVKHGFPRESLDLVFRSCFQWHNLVEVGGTRSDTSEETARKCTIHFYKLSHAETLPIQ